MNVDFSVVPVYTLGVKIIECAHRQLVELRAPAYRLEGKAMAIYHFKIKTAGGRAGEKIDYISREGKWEKSPKKEELLCVESQHMPEWAVDKNDFWSEMDSQEKKNAYREIILALPKELNFEQQKTLISNYCAENLKGHPLTFAIHENIGSLSGERNPHAHIIFSERKMDGRTVEREKFCRQRSGYKKDRDITGAGRRKWLFNMRKSWELAANRALENAGSKERISCETLEKQGILRTPQKHLGEKVIAQAARSGQTLAPVEEYKANKAAKIADEVRAAILANAQTKKPKMWAKVKAWFNLHFMELKSDNPVIVNEWKQKQRDIISGKAAKTIDAEAEKQAKDVANTKIQTWKKDLDISLKAWKFTHDMRTDDGRGAVTRAQLVRKVIANDIEEEKAKAAREAQAAAERQAAEKAAQRAKEIEESRARIAKGFEEFHKRQKRGKERER